MVVQNGCGRMSGASTCMQETKAPGQQSNRYPFEYEIITG